MNTVFFEWAGTLFNLIFLWLLIKRNIWCWAFGIAGATASVILLINAKLYAESILNTYYIAAGFYGLFIWKNDLKKENNSNQKTLQLKKYTYTTHFALFLSGCILSLPLGYLLSNKTDANNPFLDAFITLFSFIATYLEAHRVLASWWYWIILNSVSAALYFHRGLPIYAGLMAVYTFMSVWGLINWRKNC